MRTHSSCFMASIRSLFLQLLVSWVLGGEAQQKNPKLIKPGSSLSPQTNLSWLSSSGRFAFGFYQEGNGFAVGIWLVEEDGRDIVWTANRDDPLVGSDASLNFTENGILFLTIKHGDKKLIANTTHEPSAAFASMLDSGNFVLYNKDFDILWKTFDYPTDTILGGQTLASGGQLISSLSKTNHSTGRFHLKMQTDGNLVLYPLNTGDTPEDAYWSSNTYVYPVIDTGFSLFLNDTGNLLIINTTSSDTVSMLFTNPDSANNSTIYQATLDVDGVFRLYSHSNGEKGKMRSSIEWSAVENACKVKSFCGFNSYCTFNDNEPYCLCLPGTDYVDSNQQSLGCGRKFPEAECREGQKEVDFYNITVMENMVWGDRPYSRLIISLEECTVSCLEDCNCDGALFQDGFCKKQKLPLRYVRRDLDAKSRGLLKVSNQTMDFPNISNPLAENPPVVIITSRRTILVIVVALSLFVFSGVSLATSGVFIYKFQILKYKRLLEDGNLEFTTELTLRLFSYHDLKTATSGFKEELGKGSFGAVYKGSLYKGKKLIAVKRLEKLVEEGEREFQAEMRAIGRAHHRNLVRLLGYCSENSKRLLIYEYMPNGSLADLLFKDVRRPAWDERVRIATDVAKGLLYLHEECEAQIIHCDIKPQNILMDEFLTAKISDFGLAKLLMPDQTRTFTMVRGTRGYLAPEWQKNAPISLKVDVYSYGIVLLETVCCRKNMEMNVSDPEEMVLSSWAYKCFVTREINKLVGCEEVDMTSLDNMVKIGLWCIQDEPALRPSMKSVVLMLQGITDIAIPPSPTTSTIN